MPPAVKLVCSETSSATRGLILIVISSNSSLPKDTVASPSVSVDEISTSWSSNEIGFPSVSVKTGPIAKVSPPC